jgi:PAS domain S-box-containing protein
VNDVAPHLSDREALLERRVTLDPDPTSARHAREVLRDVLRSAGRDEWRDAGELAVSEVVTNAALHAHTSIELHVGVYDDEVCVGVRDSNPTLPVQRNYDDEATTGRGMGLVAALARSCGVHPLGHDGKVVWFCVGDADDDRDADALLDAWDIDVPADAADDECTDVVLPAMPATLWLSARQHHDAIMRELVLYLAEHDDIDVDVASADRARSTISATLVTALERARAEGSARPPVPDDRDSRLPWVPEHLDLTISVPADVRGGFAVLQDVLDLAESLAVEGELFNRPALPEIVAVRDWACEQVIAQLAGAPASPWPGTDQERFETEIHDRAGNRPDWDPAVVVEAGSPVVAADDANRIIAVSAPFARLVGWEPGELVGRRIVTIVPPRFREAHVAGFSRHLSTGEANVLGMPVELPVLARDGSEITCRLLIELAPATTGRAVYLARLDPIATGT